MWWQIAYKVRLLIRYSRAYAHTRTDTKKHIHYFTNATRINATANGNIQHLKSRACCDTAIERIEWVDEWIGSCGSRETQSSKVLLHFYFCFFLRQWDLCSNNKISCHSFGRRRACSAHTGLTLVRTQQRQKECIIKSVINSNRNNALCEQ